MSRFLSLFSVFFFLLCFITLLFFEIQLFHIHTRIRTPSTSECISSYHTVQLLFGTFLLISCLCGFEFFLLNDFYVPQQKKHHKTVVSNSCHRSCWTIEILPWCMNYFRRRDKKIYSFKTTTMIKKLDLHCFFPNIFCLNMHKI